MHAPRDWAADVAPPAPPPPTPRSLANALVGNDDGAAALEVTLTGPTMKFLVDSGEEPAAHALPLAYVLPSCTHPAHAAPDALPCGVQQSAAAWPPPPAAVVAVCGAAAPVSLDGQPVPMWQSFGVKRGQVVKVGATEGEPAAPLVFFI